MKETNNKMKFIAGTAAIVAAACATGVVNADEVTVSIRCKTKYGKS